MMLTGHSEALLLQFPGPLLLTGRQLVAGDVAGRGHEARGTAAGGPSRTACCAPRTATSRVLHSDEIAQGRPGDGDAAKRDSQ